MTAVAVQTYGQSAAGQPGRPGPCGAGPGLGGAAASFGNRLVTSRAVREQHANTVTWIRPQPPDAVVYPQSADEVASVVRLCAAQGVPVIPFGAGTSLEGHTNAPFGGVCIDFAQMNAIPGRAPRGPRLRRPAGGDAQAAQRAPARHGAVLPIDPGADATIGGMVSTRASGPPTRCATGRCATTCCR